MTNYRRDFTAGATYFFTVNLADRSSQRLVEDIASLRHALRVVQARHPFTIDAIVVLPDHLHALWTLPAGEADFALRWRMIKTIFSRTQPRNEHRSQSRQAKAERGIWQRRFWERRIRDEQDFAMHAHYIHINPLKHGLVSRVADWPWSTFHRYVRDGTLAEDWADEAARRMALRSERGRDGFRLRLNPSYELDTAGCASLLPPTLQ
jgi:putative transposase